MFSDIAGLTTKQLQDEFKALAPQLAHIHNRRRAIAAELDERKRRAVLKNRVEQMSENDRDSLREALRSTKL